MEIPNKQPQCSWPVHADMLTEKDERIQLWKPDRHRRSDSSIPHPKDAVTKTPHSSSSDRSAPGWATLGKQNPVPWLTHGSSPRPRLTLDRSIFTGQYQALGRQFLLKASALPALLPGPALPLPCSALQLFGIGADQGWAAQAGRRYPRTGDKGTTGTQIHPPKEQAQSSSTALFHLLPASPVGSAEPGAGCAPPCA